jgi:hypothetical protein
MKDHEIASLITEITEIAKKHPGSQQLRERLKPVIIRLEKEVSKTLIYYRVISLVPDKIYTMELVGRWCKDSVMDQTTIANYCAADFYAQTGNDALVIWPAKIAVHFDKTEAEDFICIVHAKRREPEFLASIYAPRERARAGERCPLYVDPSKSCEANKTRVEELKT